MQYLIERGVIKDDEDEVGMTALYLAAENDHLPVVQYLVEQGADKDKVTNDDTSPLSTAAFNGHLGMVQYRVPKRIRPTIRAAVPFLSQLRKAT